MGKGLASAIDTGEKVVDSTKHTFGSAKRKATDTTQDAHGMAKEKMNQASESTKQTTENARQKVNQAAGEAGNKADRVRPFFTTSPHRSPDIYLHTFQVQAGYQQAKEDMKSETRK